MINVFGLVKKYNKKEVLSNVSIEVNKGEFVSLIGPNGAGKTTLIRSILALIKPDKGEVRIMGKDPFKDKSIFKNLGYVQELPNLPPFMTGREVLMLSAKLKGAKKDDVDELLDIVGMAEFADRQIAKYSKGMTQRIAIAEALLGNPEVMILDEPNIGIDPIFSVKVREMFNKLKKNGSLILMTSHELEDVKKLSDRVYMIYKGKIVFEGSVEQLVREFLGINVIIETNEVEKVLNLVSSLEYVKRVYRENSRVVVSLSQDKREELLKYLIQSNISVKGFYLDLNLEEAYARAINSVGNNAL
ncbi:ABC transporter ATP-binding protein [Sulfurisphaera ohwakuensis]|uniref:ABC-2 type transport system ATP-binding protein n=1 Tax=Sulfurisphaera ohwakuensis TaxID=69656 RepID=A0A650CJQ4_SULOH|nr:ABC transporter ATP-binding protein [Sulfurisphaera ohwakuensis]MBB5254738.1 ABC-2 type transport system ATP-binding protein [Sulfurisphaera ohwakuensis]QGR18062.1 ATP-binding cassette domain-containing protein [Sulfurisphaera ohwakuensis]